jgi:hypothetical protein
MTGASVLDAEKIFKFIFELIVKLWLHWTVDHNSWTLEMKRQDGFAIKENELNVSILN